MTEVTELLREYSQAIEDLLEREVPRGHPDISEGAWYQLGGGGKRLRPALCLAACKALGGDTQQAMPFALATEMFHNFLLVHDDIEDGDTMRRDRRTLWAEFGVPNAINVADYLIARTYALVLATPVAPDVRLELARALATTFERTVEGQALDINLRGDPDTTLETYYRIVELKTAYYLALPLVGGALIAGLPGAEADRLWELGRSLGPAFQIRDDLLDLTEGKGRGGEIGCDLREGKPSILFAYVFEKRAGSDTERRRLGEIVRKPREETTTEDVRWAIGFYKQSGAIAFARSEAQSLIERADRVLETLPFPASGKELFRGIGRYIVERNT
jgi:geranylgeranyl pyrophosphate synthase